MDVNLLKDDLIKRAYDFAELSLAGKKRYSGEFVVDHCLNVAKIVNQFHVMDKTTLAAAVLHHSLSDGAANILDIEKEFGKDISLMITSIESIRVIKLPNVSRKEFLESLRKMFLVLAKDLRVVIIKFADIMDNLRTIDSIPQDKQKEVASEVIEIFAPMAERLGMGEIKGKMQDLAFPYLLPEEYKKTKRLLHTKISVLERDLLKIKGELKLALAEEKIDYRIESRTKHLYSLYTKLKREEIDFDISRIYDLIAFRIILKNTEDCYRVLGIVHKIWKPMPDYVRDYIANPKLNGYKSIHTTVFGPSSRPFEIQIRTEQMHEDAEYGVAAHWHYAEIKSQGVSEEALSKGVNADSGRLKWVKQLSKWQEEIVDNEEFLRSVKTDFFGERIFVFTPKGDVIDIPSNSTPVDFAYKVHSDLGNLAIGAKVNGKMVGLNTKLKNSDVCEIIISKDKNHKPNRDWLRFVVSATARRKIRKFYIENQSSY